MFISDKFLYLELGKTGCTRILDILLRLPSINGYIYRKHNSLDDLDTKLMVGKIGSRPIIGSIRNPWDWYVSSWAYGCLLKGFYYNTTVKKFYWYKGFKKAKAIRAAWEEVYSDSNNPELFRKWLHLIYETERQQEIPRHFAKSSLSKYAGIYTFSYLRLFTKSFRKNHKKLTSFSELLNFAKKNERINYVIRSENLDEDVTKCMNKVGVSDRECQEAISHLKLRTNASKHQGYSYYYNQRTKSLVASREKYLIEKYNYTF